jgi:nitrate/TMAO reductase-like tetraheme cytochrome c subunit
MAGVPPIRGVNKVQENSCDFYIGRLAGLDFSGALVSFIRHSDTLNFCISSQEMRGTVYEEHARTTHDENTSVVRALRAARCFCFHL